MLKIIGLSVFLALAVLSSISHAEDYSKHCPTMFAIYGVCSEELVINFLAHTSEDTPRVSKAGKPTSEVNQFPKVERLATPYVSPASLAEDEVGPKALEEKPSCWYWTTEGWKVCNMVS